jgi:hypothetical protein
MRVLLDHPNPFLLAHGGFQIQIEQTYAALKKIGVDVEYLHWWDADQKGDIIHYFGRPAPTYFDFAQANGIRVLAAPLLTGLGSRSSGTLRLQKTLMQSARKILPNKITAQLGWDAFQRADACVR